MSSLLANEWILIPTIALIVSFITYLWADKVLLWLHQKSLGQREEVIQLMDRMFIDTDPRKVTAAMLVISFGFGALAFILLWPKLFPGMLLGTIITIAGWSLPKLVISALFEKRCNRVIDQMVDGLTIMANGVRSGLSVTQSMERVVENIGGPIGQEFGLALSQVRIGRSVEEALNDLGERIPRPDMQMFVTSINILKETGGNLAETFETIVITVRERQKIEKKIQALTAQGLMQGIIITLVPFILLIVFFVMDPNYIKPLFSTTLGIIFLIIMIGLQVIGGLMIRKIVKINV